jgi:hypothetical protein
VACRKYFAFWYPNKVLHKAIVKNISAIVAEVGLKPAVDARSSARERCGFTHLSDWTEAYEPGALLTDRCRVGDRPYRQGARRRSWLKNAILTAEQIARIGCVMLFRMFYRPIKIIPCCNDKKDIELACQFV